MIPTGHFLIIGAILFCLGLYAVLSRNNAVQILIGIELMLNASVLNVLAASRYDRIQLNGQVFALFIIVLAAASVAVGLAIILTVYRRYNSINPDTINKIKE